MLVKTALYPEEPSIYQPNGKGKYTEKYIDLVAKETWHIRGLEKQCNLYQGTDELTDSKIRRYEWVDYLIRRENYKIQIADMPPCSTIIGNWENQS